eukprot:3200484-Pyramimonas_sp.AAC.1
MYNVRHEVPHLTGVLATECPVGPLARKIEPDCGANNDGHRLGGSHTEVEKKVAPVEVLSDKLVVKQLLKLRGGLSSPHCRLVSLYSIVEKVPPYCKDHRAYLSIHPSKAGIPGRHV